MQHLTPMDAVAALYSKDDPELAAAIIASLGRAVFEESPIRPAGRAKKALARISHRVLKWTTRVESGTDEMGCETTVFRNSLLERSGHPYARTLLVPSSSKTASLVQGGDPMNAPYMMLAPEIRRNCGLWDRLFLDSVQCRDVQSRIIWETRATHESAKLRLERGEPVRLKAVAAGTGLSMILVYDKLLRDGFDPALITARITDKEISNVDRANHLLDTLAATRRAHAGFDWRRGISAGTEDILGVTTPRDAGQHDRWDVVTAIGIIEYFQGGAYTTTEQKLGLDQLVESVTAHDLVLRLTEMTSERARLIVNTCKDDACTRILELFGKRFDYRSRKDLRALLASVNFQPVRLVGSGNIYDVEVYERNPTPPEEVGRASIRAA